MVSHHAHPFPDLFVIVQIDSTVAGAEQFPLRSREARHVASTADILAAQFGTESLTGIFMQGRWLYRLEQRVDVDHISQELGHQKNVDIFVHPTPHVGVGDQSGFRSWQEYRP